MSDSTETPGLAEAREALVEHYKEWCDHPTGCGLPANHPEDFHTMQYPVDDMAMHLRAALAEVDRLTAALDVVFVATSMDHHGPLPTTPDLAAVVRAKLAAYHDSLTDDLSVLRIEYQAVCGLLTHTRRDRDEARAHNADLRTHDVSVIKAQARAYEAGVKAAANVVACAPVCPTGGECYACDRARDILALLEPKP